MRERFLRWLIKILKVKGVHIHRDPIRKEKVKDLSDWRDSVDAEKTDLR